MMQRKQILLAVIAVAIVLLLALVLRPSPVPVSATEVRSGYFAEYVEDEGRTRLRDTYTVSAPIGGYLRRVELEPGDTVAVGAAVFEMESMPAPALDARSREQAREAVAAAGARLEAAEAELETRQTQFQLAETEYQRSEQLHERNLISSEERDRRRALRDSSRAAERAARHSVEVTRFELESARAVLEIADGERSPGDQPSLEVRSPIAGTVTRRHRCCEGPVSAGEPILELGDLDDLEVQVDLLSMDAVRLRAGMRVILERWGGDEALEGTVRRVEPAGFMRVSALGVEEQRVPVLVQITSPRSDWAQLGEGYRVEGRFILWESDDVLQIPTSTLFRDDDRWVVYVVENGRAELRPVSIGRRSGLWTQISSGLERGEVVITHPGDRVTSGVRVAVDLRSYRN
ncbi:MAG: efflux RND transporter periplasmic adaptor subunit [Gammaproteobacteria bacterium]|nr:MAG: efflux RND transporter periplasmic adaptor subunit [Gammaproteobacteria bacterium]